MVVSSINGLRHAPCYICTDNKLDVGYGAIRLFTHKHTNRRMHGRTFFLLQKLHIVIHVHGKHIRRVVTKGIKEASEPLLAERYNRKR
ncbi:hypothetical protein KP509_23G001000 [Ceratopteris richardii]|uniref:Uncharacterized protein n=1 Tax=Ceratopteris richardii TaxID=49495 RepID=A0A8T2RYU3_CERRI|nr:hypothetical protein KP509_23G001000 [Ceratopteris richardii]